MRNPQVSYDVDVNTTTCDCCGGEVYDDNILRVMLEGPERLNLCEECVEELPEPLDKLKESDQLRAIDWPLLVEHCKRSRAKANEGMAAALGRDHKTGKSIEEPQQQQPTAARQMLETLREIRAWLVSPDLSPEVLQAYQHDCDLAIARAEKEGV